MINLFTNCKILCSKLARRAAHRQYWWQQTIHDNKLTLTFIKWANNGKEIISKTFAFSRQLLLFDHYFVSLKCTFKYYSTFGCGSLLSFGRSIHFQSVPRLVCHRTHFEVQPVILVLVKNSIQLFICSRHDGDSIQDRSMVRQFTICSLRHSIPLFIGTWKSLS